MRKKDTIGIVGLGYVGLPLAVEFGKHLPVIGFDINTQRLNELLKGIDHTLEISSAELHQAKHLQYTDQPAELKKANIFIATVPTPIDRYKRPDLTPVIKATETIAKALKKGDIVIYESTVYPGCTEEVCVPILEKLSGLKFNKDFYCGYSPERINPGDKKHRLTTITKVVSGSTPASAKRINRLYGLIVKSGTHLAPSIKVAEAAKVIENTQRDINIAFMNELALIFDRMGIDTQAVLKAAGTKWNFLPFKPGLVGGHCIGVDPYYLTHKAESLGYHPEVILSGRRINDEMGFWVARKMIKLMIQNGHRVNKSRVLVLGITFKENCPDIRNSRVIDIIRELKDFDVKVDVYDPWADAQEVKRTYNLTLVNKSQLKKYSYNGIVLAVAHQQFLSLHKQSFSDSHTVFYDIKGILPSSKKTFRL